VVRPMLNLWSGMPGARMWRRVLTEGTQRRDAQPTVIREAWDAMSDRAARFAPPA
jgi:tRNA-dihydrouridine synthase A